MQMGVFFKLFSKLFSKSNNASVRKDNLKKDENKTKNLHIDSDGNSLHSFASARSSEEIEKTLSSNIDLVAKSTTPLGLQPRPSVDLIRHKLRLPANVIRPSTSEGPARQKHRNKAPTAEDLQRCTADEHNDESTTISRNNHDECDESFSIRTPNITFGTTLTAVGALVADADRMRNSSQPATTLVLKAVNEGYYNNKSEIESHSQTNIPRMVPSHSSRLSISSIHSPLQSKSESSALPQAYNSHPSSPDSSSSCSSCDQFSAQHRRRRQPFDLRGFYFDPTSLPPYQMIETPEKHRSKPKKQAMKTRMKSIVNTNDFTLSSNAMVYRNSDLYTSSMVMTSPSSSVDRNYSGDESSSSSDEEQEMPQLMLLTPGKDRSTQKVSTPTQRHNHRSLIMTSPPNSSVYLPRAYCNAATAAARYLEESFDKALVHQQTPAEAILPVAQLQTREKMNATNPRIQSLCNEPIHTITDSMVVNFNDDSRGLANRSSLSLLDRRVYKEDCPTSDGCSELVCIKQNRDRNLPYDFNIIDGCNKQSPGFAFDPSFDDLSNIAYLNPADSYTATGNPNLLNISLSDYNKIFLLSSEMKETSETSPISSVMVEEDQEQMVIKQMPILRVPPLGDDEMLLERKRQNQLKSKEVLLRRTIRQLQDKPEFVVEIEARSDDLYERCPRYVQSSCSLFDGPLFLKTITNAEGIIPGYTDVTRARVLHQLSLHYSSLGDKNTDLKDALDFVVSLVNRTGEEHEKEASLTPFESDAIARKIFQISDSTLSPGFTAPTVSHTDANLSLASTISSKVSHNKRKLDLADCDQTRRTILITCSVLQKISYTLQNLIDDEIRNNDDARITLRHCYLQLMNLPRKDIQDVLDLFVVEDERSTCSKLDKSAACQLTTGGDNKSFIPLSPLLPRQASASHEEASDSHHLSVGSSWMNKYEAVMDNILAQNKTANNIVPASLATGKSHLPRKFIPTSLDESDIADNENMDITFGVNSSKKQSISQKKNAGNIKNGRNIRIVLGSL